MAKQSYQFLPRFKGWHFIPEGTNVPFMTYRRVCFWTSIAMMLAAMTAFLVLGLNYGVDFKGGTMIELRAKSGNADIPDLRTRVGGLGLGDVQIQEFGDPRDVLIRVEQQAGGETSQQEALRKIQEVVSADYDQRRVEVVGPAVSGELRLTGLIAVLAAIVAIILYIWLRFEWQFAIGAVLALTHDVLITMGLFAVLQLEFDLSIVAALLTILGYSVNDTVVVADRIRENLRKYKRMVLPDLLNRSINETLSRTLMTSGTTLIVLMALYLFGGEVIRNFAFAMLFGVVIGTYSSIFIAAPVLELLGVKRDWSGLDNEAKASAQPSAS
ncbi:MAG: protein translocase subunit SecF [Pseudomonadota bacterium]